MITKLLLIVTLAIAGSVCTIPAAKAQQILPGHVPEAIARLHLQPIGRLAATNELWLAIGLPLRDQAGLEQFVVQVSDPASPNFRHYLTREELTARFGPTEQDYEAVKNFKNSLVVKFGLPQLRFRLKNPLSSMAIKNQQQRGDADKNPKQHSLNGGFPAYRMKRAGRKACSDQAKHQRQSAFGDMRNLRRPSGNHRHVAAGQ